MKKYNAPRVKESRRVQLLTTIWLVPFVALVIALWLAYQYYAKIGSTIEISFKSNAGLIENQSPIKMRDVTVGVVKKIALSNDGEGVVIKARMNIEVDDYLNEKAKFWIVHPDVGSHGISGLDTIVSGSYIELYGEKSRKTKKRYVGLEKEYMAEDIKGKYFILSAPKSYNIREGSNVYYRMIKVGKVKRVGLSPDGTHVNFTAFVKDKYTKFINSKSKFYTKSTFNVDISKAKLDVSLAPFSQLLHGGISIYTPSNSLDKNYTIEKGVVFPLYKNLAEMQSRQLGVGGEYKIYKLSFKEPSRKLEVGSPVEFKGYQVGHVTQIEDRYSDKNRTIQSDIFVLLYVNAFTPNRDSKTDTIAELVKDGLKAKLAISMPLIGSQYIELVFNRQKEARVIKTGEYEILPTIENSPKKNIMDKIDALLAKLQNLPLEKLLLSLDSLVSENREPINRVIKDLDKTIINFNKTVSNLNSFTSQNEFNRLPKNLSDSLKELESTLVKIQELSNDYSGNSKFADQLSVTLKSVSEASNSFDKINKMLDRNANALVVGDD